MKKFYGKLNSRSNTSAYWYSLSVLRLTTLNALTGSTTFLEWDMW